MFALAVAAVAPPLLPPVVAAAVAAVAAAAVAAAAVAVAAVAGGGGCCYHRHKIVPRGHKNGRLANFTPRGRLKQCSLYYDSATVHTIIS